MEATGYYLSGSYLTYPWVELELDAPVLMTGIEIHGYVNPRYINSLMIRAGNETTSMTDFVDSTVIDDKHPLITVYREV